MQEQLEMNDEKDAEEDRKDLEKWELALAVLKEAATNSGIKNVTEYKGESAEDVFR